ncbi:PREDICTED: autophagy-related protein 13 homolog isoform X3 [Polistes canadensis]|uniref:autophagy-related protein 13 homolog isoform X3 n=1 Tax=Polistes canadensis TaxID=91411 RepID=UPI000718E69E|nr:PREDICTED: autophagy-related protein 13 homolog isoform X3 [Polistes canadensis]XP_014610335.1 PREDICTED: autophagy-related protein 13 homolog isoform X3 [Polistes canadensis]XP_014610336.1 PREDICTED: autophagy-related protein 13 homolog isoform X3 [Polistes canadensis]XP_014610338.1 PREDICTED: autophagy-related protein 13 homolog isoform X3 [Polistes canadensis]XP_014610339.1 PREDICTED: autophagy-related protein 13 homolog isoform X3 [Polistes canadensis]XP_014610340.1 PREDICTED: autophagy
MSTLKLSMQDKKDLDKFIKFLALKAAQIIVQSRSGEKVCTKCKPNSKGTDWFNLAVQDLPDALADAKRALNSDIASSTIPLCIEISLRTVEGDTMVLETWCLGVLPEHSDPTVRVTYTVYNRMGILLKSLLSVSRVTPAYKLSRRQGPDSYVICYNIYMGEPQLHTLGDNYKHVRVGQLCTPVGTIHLSVLYRTKMTISPTHTGRDSIMLKSDHFHSDLSPRHARYQQNEEKSKSLSDTLKMGAFAASNPPLVKEGDLVIPDVPFSSLLTPRQTSPPPGPLADTMNTKNVTTSVPTDGNNGNNEKLSNDNATSKPNSQNESRRSSAHDDFIMVDLKTPFAITNTKSDLGAFYRACQSAPQLQAFMEERTLAEQVGDLTKQLETFETNMQHYEDILSSLCQTENNN